MNRTLQLLVFLAGLAGIAWVGAGYVGTNVLALAVTALIAQLARRRTSGGFSTPGTGQRSSVRTQFLDAWIDHGSGEMGASVLRGPFSGRTLDSLSEAQLKSLHGECGADTDSLRVLESYLDRRLGPDWRGARGAYARADRLSASGERGVSIIL